MTDPVDTHAIFVAKCLHCFCAGLENMFAQHSLVLERLWLYICDKSIKAHFENEMVSHETFIKDSYQ